VKHLVRAWLDLSSRVDARDDVAGVGAALLGRWAEKQRAYHDLAHLSEVLERVDLLAAEAERPDVVRLAAWFHDAVYDATADDNEQRSAELAQRSLGRLRVDPDLVEQDRPAAACEVRVRDGGVLTAYVARVGLVALGR